MLVQKEKVTTSNKQTYRMLFSNWIFFFCVRPINILDLNVRLKCLPFLQQVHELAALPLLKK
jgi:hypothetical protein